MHSQKLLVSVACLFSLLCNIPLYVLMLWAESTQSICSPAWCCASFTSFPQKKGFLNGSVIKNLPVNAGDMGSIPGSGRSPEGRNGNPLQYSCLKNSMDRGAWWATVHGVTKSGIRLSMQAPQKKFGWEGMRCYLHIRGRASVVWEPPVNMLSNLHFYYRILIIPKN